ncbi:uncharacterized protein OCT59_021784 [Rhizophagus irregularis]|uniref:uncharacterized protein n=1 Tax=Rhizophagus irregularis TaxID=588596 RepID=UPI003320D24A|nr:hypothetical protein OCT59_021784 [Rhizophagus irregularis]
MKGKLKTKGEAKNERDRVKRKEKENGKERENERSILRFIRVGFQRTENPKIRSEGLPKNENPKIHDQMGFRVPKNGKIPRFVRVGFRVPKNGKIPKIRSGRLLKKGKPRNQDSIRWASEERKPKDSFGWLPKNENPKIHKFGWASEERKPKDKDSFRWAFVWKNQDSIGWSGLPTFGKRRTKIRLGGLLTFGKRGTKIQSDGVGFRPSGKEEPRFNRMEWASDLQEKKNQDLIEWSGLPTFGKRKTKIRKIGWASDLWEKRNQDSIGWSGLPTFEKRRTKIRKSRVSQAFHLQDIGTSYQEARDSSTTTQTPYI